MLGVGLLLGRWLHPSGPPEPVSKGRPWAPGLMTTISLWANLLNPTLRAAEEAMHAIGPAAIPSLAA